MPIWQKKDSILSLIEVLYKILAIFPTLKNEAAYGRYLLIRTQHHLEERISKKCAPEKLSFEALKVE